MCPVSATVYVQIYTNTHRRNKYNVPKYLYACILCIWVCLVFRTVYGYMKKGGRLLLLQPAIGERNTLLCEFVYMARSSEACKTITMRHQCFQSCNLHDDYIHHRLA